MKLVEEYSDQYGLNTCLAAIGLPKSTWYYWKEQKDSYKKKYEHLRELVVNIVRDHPAYGYRRILPELQDQGYPIGEFVVRKLMKCWGFTLLRSIKKPKLSGPRQHLQSKDKGWNLIKGLEDPEPFQVWYTDFTEIRYAEGRKKAYLMPILDHKTKLIAGWGIGKRRNTALALEVFKRARNNLREVGINLEDRFIHHDQDRCTPGTGGYRQC